MLGGQFADAVLRSANRLKATWLGYTYGLVVDNQDPKGRGRIRVRLPWHGPEYVSDWIPKLNGFNAPGAGETFTIPEPGDVVEVRFLGGDINRPAYGAVLHALDIPYGEANSNDDSLKTRYKQWYEATPPIAADSGEAESKALAYMGNGRANVWRSRGGWKLWISEIGRRLRFWSNDKSGERSYTLDLDQRQTPYKLTLETPYGCRVYIEDDQDSQTIRLLLPNGYKMELAKSGSTTSGFWGKPGSAEFSFSAQSGSETLIVKAPSSNSVLEIGPAGIRLSSDQLIKIEGAACLINADSSITLDAPGVNVNG